MRLLMHGYANTTYCDPLFHPDDVLDGPSSDELAGPRTTHCTFTDRTTITLDDSDFRKAGKRELRLDWVGEAVLEKRL